MMGAGKSTVGMLAARALGLPFVGRGEALAAGAGGAVARPSRPRAGGGRPGLRPGGPARRLCGCRPPPGGDGRSPAGGSDRGGGGAVETRQIAGATTVVVGRGGVDAAPVGGG